MITQMFYFSAAKMLICIAAESNHTRKCSKRKSQEMGVACLWHCLAEVKNQNKGLETAGTRMHLDLGILCMCGADHIDRIRA